MSENPFQYKCIDEKIIQPHKLVETISKMLELDYVVELHPQNWNFNRKYRTEYVVKVMKTINEELEE